eukprot:IDg2349t1
MSHQTTVRSPWYSNHPFWNVLASSWLIAQFGGELDIRVLPDCYQAQILMRRKNSADSWIAVYIVTMVFNPEQVANKYVQRLSSTHFAEAGKLKGRLAIVMGLKAIGVALARTICNSWGAELGTSVADWLSKWPIVFCAITSRASEFEPLQKIRLGIDGDLCNRHMTHVHLKEPAATTLPIRHYILNFISSSYSLTKPYTAWLTNDELVDGNQLMEKSDLALLTSIVKGWGFLGSLSRKGPIDVWIISVQRPVRVIAVQLKRTHKSTPLRNCVTNIEHTMWENRDECDIYCVRHGTNVLILPLADMYERLNGRITGSFTIGELYNDEEIETTLARDRQDAQKILYPMLRASTKVESHYFEAGGFKPNRWANSAVPECKPNPVHADGRVTPRTPAQTKTKDAENVQPSPPRTPAQTKTKDAENVQPSPPPTLPEHRDLEADEEEQREKKRSKCTTHTHNITNTTNTTITSINIATVNIHNYFAPKESM